MADASQRSLGGQRARVFEIGPDDPLAPDVAALIESHLVDMHGQSPPEHVHALQSQALAQMGVQFFSARSRAELVAIGALKAIGPDHAELKSMRTAPAWRRRGVGAQILAHLLAVAREQGFARASLETGTMDYFAPARAMYHKAGFVVCPPFGAYTDNPYSVCMTIALD